MKLTKNEKRTELERLIDEKLEIFAEDSKEIDDIREVIELMERREKLKEKKFPVSPDTVAIVVGNLLGIGLILGYERAGIITTKALGFVLRGRV